MDLFDWTTFGSELKKLRKELGLSQIDIQKITKINPDTIRRIELGEVRLRIETLEQLSITYKVDLFELLKNHRLNKIPYINEVIANSDKMIIENDFRSLTIEIKKLDLFLKNNRYKYDNVRLKEIAQLADFLKVSQQYEKQELGNLIDAEIKLIDCIKITMPDFELLEYKDHKYSYLESRVLLLLALVMSKEKNTSDKGNRKTLCADIFKFLLMLYEDGSVNASNCKLIPTIYFNLAYFYHRIEDDLAALKYAQKGIICAIDYRNFDLLALLYFREGVAKYHLKINDYNSSFDNSLCLLNSLNLVSRYEQVKKAIDKFK